MKKMATIMALGITLGSTFVFATNVACVGNSITEGYGLSFQEDYPYQLQHLLGSDYKVKNFGVSGMTFAGPTIKAGVNNSSYWGTAKFTDAMASEPNIVVIELGTNDSKYFMSNYSQQGLYNYLYGQCEKAQLYTDYEALIDTFTHLPSAPEIIATLQPYSNNASWAIMDSAIVNQINPLIKETAIKKGVNLIDLHSQFKTPEWFLADSVHPNPTGAKELAKIIQKYITLKKPQVRQQGSSLQLDQNYEGAYWYKNGALVNEPLENSLAITETGSYKALVKVEAESDSWILTAEIKVTDLEASTAPGETTSLDEKRSIAKPKLHKLNHQVDVKGRRVR